MPLLMLTAMIIGIGFGSVADAQLQRMLIPSGTYRIGADGAGLGSGTLPSYCVDEDFEPPGSGSHYQYVVGGGGNSTVTLPGQGPIPLSRALNNGDVKVFGSDSGIQTLRVEAPNGTEIKIDGPVVLSAELWLEKASTLKLKEGTLELASKQLRGSSGEAHRHVQLTLWKELSMARIESVLGKKGRQLAEQALEGREFGRAEVSTMGEHPILRLTSRGQGEFFSRREIIRREGGEMVRRAASEDETTLQMANVHARLRALATDETSFVALTSGPKAFLVKKGSTKPEMLDWSGQEPFAAVSEWLESRKGPGKPNIIVVSDTSSGFSSFIARKLREVSGGRARIYEDDDPALAIANVKAQQPVRSGDDLAVYRDATIQSGEIFDKDIVEALENAGIRLPEEPRVVEAGNVIIVTGHKDEAYRGYLAELAMSGTLRGKSVALISCGSASDREFSRFLIRQGGATCVLRVNDVVDSAAAREVLIQVAQRAASLPTDGKYLDELLQEAANAAAERHLDKDFEEQIRAILDHSLQVSQLLKGLLNHG